MYTHIVHTTSGTASPALLPLSLSRQHRRASSNALPHSRQHRRASSNALPHSTPALYTSTLHQRRYRGGPRLRPRRGGPADRRGRGPGQVAQRPALACAVHIAHMGQQLADGNSSCCPELEVWTKTHRRPRRLLPLPIHFDRLRLFQEALKRTIKK